MGAIYNLVFGFWAYLLISKRPSPWVKSTITLYSDTYALFEIQISIVCILYHIMSMRSF